MNSNEVIRWKSEVLDEVFAALAADKEIEECLVFKGARVLNARLGGGRQSLDLDSNLMSKFVERYPVREDQRTYLERTIRRAIDRHFQRQNPVKFELKGILVNTYPPKAHPMGWDAFNVKLRIEDLTRAGVRGLPSIEIDVAAPEELSEASIAPLTIGLHTACAYTWERIAGEKLRAFLSSLPAYRAKFLKPGESVRVKDLYDLARIQRVIPLDRIDFWHAVGREFLMACRSRSIDCLGLETFLEQWEITSATYVKDPTIPQDISVDEALTTLRGIVEFLSLKGIIPFDHPVPSFNTHGS